MTQRSIAVRLRAEVTDFNRQISTAAKSLDQVVQASGRGEKAADTFMGRVAQSAQLQGQAWNTVGTTLAGVGAAVTGVGAAVLATGVSYNTLRQTSIAALTTLTGSAEAANRQMDKLDAFASTSPFARDVFIRAQQQMLGFGIEAQKVLPYLDAIQNAVAATGGSNHDISELSRIISQISASAKITATDLREFGNRGIDAATLIGSQMGKTGAQIREDITDGALDAGAALDALAAGMEQRYGGAADNVKETFAGAVDRVKAAWRDISSTIAEPLVSRDGGGLGVAGLNAIADAMRAFEGLPTPVLLAGTAVAGLAGAAALGAGGLLLAIPRYIAFRESLQALSSIAPVASAGIGRVVGGVGRLAVATGKLAVGTVAVAGLAAATKVLVDNAKGIDRVAPSFEVTRNALMGASTASDFYDAGLRQLVESGRTGTWVFDDFASSVEAVANQSWWDRLLGNTEILGHNLDAAGIKDATDEFAMWGEVLADLPLEEAQALFRDMWIAAGGTDQANQMLLDVMPAYAESLAATAAEAGVTGDAFNLLAWSVGLLGPEFVEAAEAAVIASEASEAFMLALAEGSQGFVDILGGWDAVIEKNREVAEAEAERANEGKKANSEHRKSWEDFYDGHSVSIGDYLDELETQLVAQREWEANMTVLAGRVSEGTLQELARLGDEGAPLVAALVDASDEELARFEDVMAAGSSTAATEFAAGLIEAIPLIRAAMTSMGDESIAELAERLRSGESTIQEEIDAWKFGPPEPVNIEADTEKAREALTGFSQDVEAWHPPMVPIDADPWEALSKLGDFATEVEGSVLVSPVDANTEPAETSLGTFAGLVIGTEESVTVDAFTVPGILSVEGLSQHTREQRPDINVGADLFRAKETVNSWHPPQKTIVLNADLSNVRDVVAQYRPQVTARIAGIFGGAADGGLWEGTVRRYADGGIDEAGHYVPRVSQIVQGGRNILWGEPETGWEAYISGKPAARLRNLDIIDDVAKRLGGRFVRPMADGGTVETPAWRRFQSLPPSTWQPSPVATVAATGQRPIEVHLHAVPMDHVEETSKALRFTMRELGLTTGYAGVPL